VNDVSRSYDSIYSGGVSGASEKAKNQFKDVMTVHTMIPEKMKTVFNSIVLGYIEEWRKRTKPIELLLDEYNKTKKDYDHYDVKIKQLEEEVQKKRKSGTSIPSKDIERITRNKQKLSEHIKPYEAARAKAMEQCKEIWEDRFIGFDSLLVRFMQFIMQYTAESGKCCSKLDEAVHLLKADLAVREPWEVRSKKAAAETVSRVNQAPAAADPSVALYGPGSGSVDYGATGGGGAYDTADRRRPSHAEGLGALYYDFIAIVSL
jgi:hypothetical protein